MRACDSLLPARQRVPPIRHWLYRVWKLLRAAASVAIITSWERASGVSELVPFAPRDRERWRYGAAMQTKRIATGCHASAFILLLRPLVDAGIVPPQLAISANSLTGYSGGGKKMIAQYKAGGDPKLDSPRPYALTLAHKHVPEMMAHTGLTTRPAFLPMVASFYKGLSVQVLLHYAHLKAGTGGGCCNGCSNNATAGERFARVMPMSDPATLEDGYFDVQASNDTNRVDIFVFAAADQALLIARLDNLGKGASGAAVQSMNVHLGLDEGLGLPG
ncbi:MAG: N-acetyl-gamma-glutamyl-phosphate reductase [Leptolyngbyaceae cyanobacterium CSU_1_4]|nr:N-acetyl-gamma-glutamyl-phosphate reductase [Leptolyngbyaceae cyanobacterium CSU_1_4]